MRYTHCCVCGKWLCWGCLVRGGGRANSPAANLQTWHRCCADCAQAHGVATQSWSATALDRDFWRTHRDMELEDTLVLVELGKGDDLQWPRFFALFGTTWQKEMVGQRAERKIYSVDACASAPMTLLDRIGWTGGQHEVESGRRGLLVSVRDADLAEHSTTWHYIVTTGRKKYLYHLVDPMPWAYTIKMPFPEPLREVFRERFLRQ